MAWLPVLLTMRAGTWIALLVDTEVMSADASLQLISLDNYGDFSL